MPICKNNPKKHYSGEEPSPKGLGYCASGEKEGKIMKGRDGKIWIKRFGKWIKKEIKKENKEDTFKASTIVQSLTKENKEFYFKKISKKLYHWWIKLSNGNIIIIFKNGKNKLIKSVMKTHKAQINDLKKKWLDFENDESVEAIIWSAQSIDAFEKLIHIIIKKNSKNKLEELIQIKDLPSYLLKNYKKYFVKYIFYGKKDYTI